MATWTAVVVPRRSYRLPNLCARCLRPGPEETSLIRSDKRRLDAFYIVAWRFEHLTIEVSLCGACDARQWRRRRLGLWLLVPGLIAAVVLGFLLHLEISQALFLAAFLAAPGAYLMEYQDRSVRVVDYNDNTMTLSIRDTNYAKAVAALNRVRGNSADGRP
jgi:hypothetical protein